LGSSSVSGLQQFITYNLDEALLIFDGAQRLSESVARRLRTSIEADATAGRATH